MKKSTYLFIGFALITAICTFYRQRDQIFLTVLKIQSPKYTVVLDAGHGGSDPGKIGSNDVLEKNINLAITLECQKILKKQNIQVILTRDDDFGLYSPSDTNKKTADMKKRRELIETSNADLAVSIHQNSYPSADVFGGQVFYYANSSEGQQLAACIQQCLRDLNPDNTRETKANTDYYILKSGACPVVICECGFLSNPKECALLNSQEYQKSMAKAIATGILSYLFQTQ